MTLNLFGKLDGIEENILHRKFKLLRDNPALDGERKVVTSWTESFVDRDNKIVKEFQTTFHSSFWEFYLHKVFKEAGFVIDFSQDRPDFIIKSPIDLNIEAVVSNIRQGGKGEENRNMDNILSMLEPPHLQENYNEFLDEAIVRNSNAILSKSKKYVNEYANCEWVDQETPFVIALSSYGQIDYGREYYYPLLALLYGLYFIPSKNGFSTVTEITKPNTTSTIPVGLFNDNSFEHISAVIFSCTTTLGKLTSLSISQSLSSLQLNTVLNIRQDYELPIYKTQMVDPDNPEELSDGLFIFHNPFAKKKISKEIFAATNILQLTFEDRVLAAEGENLPIVARLNMPKYLFNKFISIDVDKKFNRR
ncbi:MULTISPECIES: hypothetical protein [Bacteroidota]|uniref:Uncharacterized protein n=1 Tax=Pedobacter puniceum TaxID=2666136 RepID=A0A7K0FM27_9SPHI|nr:MULTISPECIES: hypothetical protein [Bacteroidota]MRX46711.1 hypothetical protein [Pedobacter puniceum]